ncbi:hypothetical protein GH714_033395 [Hevea brasiliensis]|uniref:Pentacotripeptide-repeat region of PRORP domain-containing protein n=1 Tax=Hevea brasiliensis TaxID=3981 RepID=A0A6A6NBT2_HEVBR|nr:hypothetical protein GH714_033395 [Hevea brasiliensis]
MRTVPCSMPNHVTFRILFKRYISAHLVTEAINTFDRLEEFNLKDGTSYCNLIDALCEFKHVIEAQELCFRKNMEENNAMDARNKTKIYNMILRGWFKMEWWSKCREFWEEMDRKGVYKDLYSHSIYMDILCKSGKPWKAVKLYKEMKTKGIKLDVVAYNTVIRAVAQEILWLFDRMIESGVWPRMDTYVMLMRKFGRWGFLRPVFVVWKKMEEHACSPDEFAYKH